MRRPHHRALARAVRPEQRRDLARADAERHVVDGADRAVVLREVLDGDQPDAALSVRRFALQPSLSAALATPARAPPGVDDLVGDDDRDR